MGMEREKLLKALEKIALSDPGDAITLALEGREGRKKRANYWGVSEIKIGGNGSVEIKFADRVKAISLLLEHSDTGEDGMARLLEALEEEQ